ncbi:MAG: hypothetical protein QM820_17570 [Minicystis sp.]
MLLAGVVYRDEILDDLVERFPSLSVDTGLKSWPAPDGGATQIAAGGAVSCARMKSGEAWCWGAVGWGPEPQPVQMQYGILHGRPRPVARGVERVAAGRHLRCVQRDDHNLECHRQREAATEMAYVNDIVIQDVVEAFVGVEHACVLRRDQTVACWGDNRSGQLGDGSKIPRPAPVVVPGLADVAALTLGLWHTCALTRAGAVQCWGNNNVGQLGDGTTTEHLAPRAVPGLTDVVAIASGLLDTCALLRDGTVRCWGRREFGLVNVTPPITSPEPVDGIRDAAAIAAGQRETCVVRAAGRVVCWTTLPGKPLRKKHLAGVAEVAVGDSHACARLRDGNVVCWGENDAGQVGAYLGTYELPLPHGGAATNVVRAADLPVPVRWDTPLPATSSSSSASP